MNGRFARTLPLLGLLAGGLLCGSGCEQIEARSLAKEGNTLYKAGRFPQALAKFQRAALLDPDFPTIQLHLGYTNLALFTAQGSDPDADKYARQAAAGFRRYMKLKPGDERGARFYLQTLMDSGRNSEALQFLRRQHAKNPRDVKVVASLGALASKTGHFDEALKWYEKRADLLPGEAKARYMVGTLCWRHLYKNQTVSAARRVQLADRGVTALQLAVKMQPEYAEAVIYLNLLYRERSKGQPDQQARDRDLALASKYYQQAKAMMKRKTPAAGKGDK